MTDTERIHEAQSHLGAAISQSLPTDDQTIMDHVRAAYELLRSCRCDTHGHIDNGNGSAPWSVR